MCKLSKKIQKRIMVIGTILLVSIFTYLGVIIQNTLIDINRKVDLTYHLVTIRQYQQETQTKNISRSIEANLLLTNIITGATGSGTHVVLKGEHYILTCAHLQDNPSEILRARDDTDRESDLELIKYNKAFDLALYKIINPAIRNNRYVEIGTQEPKEGEEIIVVGNPYNQRNIVTEGIVAKKSSKGYLLTNLAFFGNSGGGIYYKGKLVGVMTQLKTMHDLPRFVFTTYSYGTGLQSLEIFLEEYLEETR